MEGEAQGGLLALYDTLDQVGVQNTLAPCSSKGGIRNIQGPVRNAESQVPLKTY